MKPNAFIHQIFDFARFIGMRDRLRCPMCHAVGTWKPHGGWMDFADERKVRRWLCKWCGWYHGPEGYAWAEISEVNGVWTLEDESQLDDIGYCRDTPKRRACNANPWRG